MDERFAFRLPSELLARIDQWRCRQPIQASRAAAIRYLIETRLDDIDHPASLISREAD